MNMAVHVLGLQAPSLPEALAVEWPGGRSGAASAAVRLRLRHRHQLTRLALGRIGDLADDYVRGELEIEGSTADLMAVAAALVGDPVRRGRQHPARVWWSRLVSRWHHLVAQDARQVRFHYDLDEGFHALWLDPLRVYSCAYFSEPSMDLAQAQQAKLDLVCRKLQLAPGQRFLDMGAGWGGLLVWAATRYRVQAVGVTLSRHQFDHVNALIDAHGLRGRAEVRLMDYRALPEAGAFDRIASIGMFEHVGREQLDRYFATLHRLLRPGGLALNHGIAAGGVDNLQLGAGMGRFIERHIFPGGELVHVSRAAEALARGGLELLDAENLRPHYARTLWAWSQALEARLERARELTDEATVRAYQLYLAGSAMCFERGWLSLYQLLAARPDDRQDPARVWAARSDYPFTRRHMPA